MTFSDNSNILFRLAADLVNHSSRHIFLTGKAGTGKTTFLKYIREHSHKKMAIVAPTGVAAINAGGVTMHSLFQLPFGCYLPVSKHISDDYNGLIHNRHSLMKNLRLNQDKKTLLNELDLIIIDEVSMVRADLLDATDANIFTVKAMISSSIF
jgi:Cdc6-like AAA superfamily ATPase